MRPTYEILSEVTALGDEKAGFGAVETERGRLPLKAMDLSGRITGLHFRNKLSQTFVNAYPVPLEATYIFPLPDRAAVVSFKMKIADRVIDGVLKEREEARMEYDEAIAAGRRAAIAEEERADVFTMRAGNIMPGEAITVELELSGPLQFSDGEATYRFPLVVAQRYIPGIPLDGESVGSGTAVDTDAVPDASRITPPVLLPGQPNPVFFSLSLELDPADLPVDKLRSSLHDLAVEELAEGMLRVSLQPGATRLDRDFILRFSTGEEAVVTSLRCLPDEGGNGSTFALTVVPPTLKKAGQSPRDVVVVLDRSGSMSGWKMVAARRAAARIVDSLTVHDRFAVLLFDSVLEEPFETSGKLVEASDRNRFRAIEFLAKVEARGGTEIGPALARSLDYFRASEPNGRQRVVAFVTDGQVGNEAQVLEVSSRGAQDSKVRIHTVGIDRSVNASFLRDLAGRSGGLFELVESEERLDEVLLQIHRRIGQPVLTQVELEFPGLPASELTPEQADVFPGVPLVLSGRLSGAVPAQAVLRARQPDGKVWQKKVKVAQAVDPVTRHVWARARVLDMQHVLDVGRGASSLGEEITAFSLKWGVLCRFTAFVAVDKSQVANPSGEVHRVTQAVEMASGWQNAPAACAAPARAGRSMPGPASPPQSPPMFSKRILGAPPPQQPEGWLGGISLESVIHDASAAYKPKKRAKGERAEVPESSPLREQEADDAADTGANLYALKDLLPGLNKAVGAWKKGERTEHEVFLKAVSLLDLLGHTELAAEGRVAWTIFQGDKDEGFRRLDAWVEAVYKVAGVTRRKSWWKR